MAKEIQKLYIPEINGKTFGESGSLVNYIDIENSIQDLTGEILSRTQAVLGLKINEIIGNVNHRDGLVDNQIKNIHLKIDKFLGFLSTTPTTGVNGVALNEFDWYIDTKENLPKIYVNGKWENLGSKDTLDTYDSVKDFASTVDKAWKLGVLKSEDPNWFSASNIIGKGALLIRTDAPFKDETGFDNIPSVVVIEDQAVLNKKLEDLKQEVIKLYTNALDEYIKKDGSNLSQDEKDKFIQELLGWDANKATEIANFPDKVKQLEAIIKPGYITTFLDQIDKNNAPYDTHAEVDNKITTALAGLRGTLTTDPNNPGYLILPVADRGKQIVLTEADGTTPISIDNPNSLVNKKYVDDRLDTKLGLEDGLIDIHDELRFKKITDENGNEVSYVFYYNFESDHYVNEYITSLETYDGFTGVSVSASEFSIYERLSSIGNEFSGQLIGQNDWTEYEFNVKWKQDLKDPYKNGVGDDLIKVRFIATGTGAEYKFKRYDDKNITLSVVNAKIEIKQGNLPTITHTGSTGYPISIDELFLGDKFSSLTKFRVFLENGIIESDHNGDSYAPLLQLSMKAHSEYAIRRIIITERRDVKLLESNKQDKLTTDQITAINKIPSTVDFDSYLLKSKYDLIESSDGLVFRDNAKPLLLKGNGTSSFPINNPDAAVPKKYVDGKIAELTGGGIGSEIDKKFSEHSDNLTSNSKTATDTAKIGEGYKGDSHYSFNSTGKVSFGGADNPAGKGTVELGHGAAAVNIGEYADLVKVGETAEDTQIYLGSNVIKKDADGYSKIFKADGTAGISIEDLSKIDATLSTQITSAVNTATKANDWELVSDVPVIQFTTSPGSGGTGSTTAAGIPWLTDKYTDLSKFENDGKNYEVVKFNLNKDGSNNPEGIQFLVKVGAEVKQFKTWEEIVVFLEANNWEAVKKINDFTFSASSTGGAIAYSEHFGDLDDQAQRTNFMNNVKIGYWYTFNIGGNPYQAAIVSGDKTSNFIWAGKRVIQGATGKTTEFVAGSTSATGHSETASSFTGDAFSPSIALPNSYTPTQYMPTDAIKQLILDNNASLTQNVSDPTWQSLTGTQTTSFNASQITIDITNSQLKENDIIQLLLWATGGNMVLNGALKIYGNAADASRNGYVAGQYKWYAYKFSDTVIKFVMEDSMGTLTDDGQTIAKFRIVTPNVQRFTAHYTSQANVLKNSVWLGDLAKGQSLIATLPTGLTLEETGYLGLSVSGTTDWDEIEGWDKVSAFYASVMTEDTSNTWWVEYKFEAVPGDNTKIKVTNFDSGNQTTSGQAYRAHWLHFKKGGK